jgi:HEPN domain-containing protein
MNVTSAKDWLVKSWHHYSSAKILFDAYHFTDCIAVDLHYSIEISLKAILAYRNDKIVKSHDYHEKHREYLGNKCYLYWCRHLLNY